LNHLQSDIKETSLTELCLSDAIHAIGTHRMKQKQSLYQLFEVTEVSVSGEIGKKTTKTVGGKLYYLFQVIIPSHILHSELLQLINSEVSRIVDASNNGKSSNSGDNRLVVNPCFDLRFLLIFLTAPHFDLFISTTFDISFMKSRTNNQSFWFENMPWWSVFIPYELWF
jgi:hypothetical protein